MRKKTSNKTFSFSTLPSVVKHRSKFNMNSHHKTTLSLGKLVPFYNVEVLPGDTFKVSTNQVSRLASSFIKVPIDNLFIDFFYFFVPNRIIFEKWQNVMGENTESAWAQEEEFEVPSMSFLKTDGITPLKVHKGSIADYLGIPTNVDNIPNINILPFHAYALIWNEWFRDQNNQDPVLIDKTATDKIYNDGEDDLKPWAPDSIYGECAPVTKISDYFTSALPAPQKGDAVSINLTGNAPVNSMFQSHETNSQALTFEDLSGALPISGNKSLGVGLQGMSGDVTGILKSFGDVTGETATLAPNNLWADMSSVTAANVNDLRFAFQFQKMLERDARGGTRYTEILQSHFGVYSPDSRLQRPEFLGGTRTPIAVQQVAQTTPSGSSGDIDANVAAYSLSNGTSGFNKGFVEHGWVIGVMCIRQKHTYQQGINQSFFRFNRLDYYDPVFANIGEQPIRKKEIFAGALNEAGGIANDEIFGYNEAWASYRYVPDRISGELRSTLDAPEDVWHYGDLYSNAPIISDSFVRETPIYVDRTIVVPSTTSDQFLVDIYVKNTAIRVMPTYSVPGLIDHN